MKYAFLVTIATFAFLISCGKKDKKQGQAGKTTPGQQLDCKGKDKDNKGCLTEVKGQIGNGDDIKASGGEAKPEFETIPNVKENDKMSIALNDQTALLAEIRINSENEIPTATKIVCGDVIDIDKLQKDAVMADPDDLKNPVANIFLFGNSTIATHLKVNKGDKTDPVKLYMLTCNSEAKTQASTFTNEKYANRNSFESRELKAGQQAFEYVSIGGKKDQGLLASFECNDDDKFLSDTVKTVNGKDKENKALNRIRLRKGSSVLVYRASEAKDGDKKLNELGSDKQKNVQYSIISCKG